MGLETGTFVDDVVTSNPIGAADEVLQGDDHLRLIKTVLKNTFPNATRAFRFEEVLTKTAAYTIVAANARALILADVSGGAFTITLPLGSTVFAGFAVIVVKSDSSANAVTVDGNGSEKINGVSTRSLTVRYQTEKYMWDGAEWKMLTITRVGSGELLDGSVINAKIGALAVDAGKLASNAVTTAKILNSNVTLGKIANIATNRILGREAGGSGVVQELTVGSGLALSAGAILVPTNAIDGTQIALGGDARGDIMFYNGSNWVRLAAGTADKFLQTKGSGADPIWALAEIARRSSISTTSGTAHGFTSIPSGTRRIVFVTDGCSLTGTDEFLIRIGDAGGYETSGYNGAANNFSSSSSSTAGFILNAGGGAANTYNGVYELVNLSGNVWNLTGWMKRVEDNQQHGASGQKTLTATLDRIQITRTGSNTFDGGAVGLYTE